MNNTMDYVLDIMCWNKYRMSKSLIWDTQCTVLMKGPK